MTQALDTATMQAYALIAHGLTDDISAFAQQLKQIRDPHRVIFALCQRLVTLVPDEMRAELAGDIYSLLESS